MKRLAWLLLLVASPALALTQGSPPPAFGIPWGSSAGSSYIRSIPVPSQIGTQNCAASLTTGFPPLTFVPAVAGGCPPFGQDFNGILNQITQWSQWQKAGGPVFYDSAFATAAGGYPNGAIVMSTITPGTLWMSTADSNTNNPDTGGSNWVQAPGQVQIGSIMETPTSVVPYGYVSANGKTIGNGSSNGTDRANADTQFLFAYVWANCSNTQCQLYNSAGTPISRGANAAADFAANDAIAVWNMNGLGTMTADSQNGSTSNFLASVPVTSGNATTPGSILGENLHSLISAENGPHTHGITDPGHAHAGGQALNQLATPGNAGSPITNFWEGPATNTSTATTGITINSSGSGTGHNTVERSMIVYRNLKL